MKIKILILLLCLYSLAFSTLAQTYTARKVDELKEYYCSDLKIRSQNFLSAMIETPDAQGFLMVYEGNYQKTVFDNGNKTIKQILPRFGEVDYRIAAIRGMLKFLKAPSEKIKIINGGFRQNHTIEFWIVPKGAIAPEPSPTLKRVKYRKGKAPRYTYWDC